MTPQKREIEVIEKIRAIRWKDGAVCPRCGSRDSRIHTRQDKSGRRKRLCSACNRTYNELTGTPFAGSHIPIWKWAICARRMIQGDPTCLELAQKIDVRIATAWRMRTILKEALNNPGCRRFFEP